MLIKIDSKKKREHLAVDNRESAISIMLRNRTMTRMIKDGKGNDSGLKREAEAIERQKADDRKQKWYSEKHKELDRMKKEFKIG